MTTLYRPVLIESAEQAEALPEGTVATSELFAPEVFVKVGPNEWFGTHGPGTMTDLTAIGWTALVPIEAEEEFTAMGTDDGEHWVAHVGRDGIDGSRKEAELYVERFGGFIARRNRTPWEETP